MTNNLKINPDDLIAALTFGSGGMSDANWYLDTETGAVLMTGDGADDTPEDIDDSPRYLFFEPIPSHESFGFMEDFVGSLSDRRCAEALSRALTGHKPFRRFKDALCEFPSVRDAWFAFERQAHLRLAKEWCEENGIAVEW